MEIQSERRVVGGVIQALQSAVLPDVPATMLSRLREDALDQLLRAYFDQARQLMPGGIRVSVSDDRVEVGPPLGPALLRFRIAERHRSADEAALGLRIVGGLLAEPGGARGTLRLALEAREAGVAACVELRDYRPSLACLPGLGRLYDPLQAWTHAVHGRRYLRWLARHWPELTAVGGRQ